MRERPTWQASGGSRRRRTGRAGFLVIAMAMLALAGCGSDDRKSVAAKAVAPAATAEPFARLDPGAFADRMGDKDAVLINVHVPYEGELDQTDAFIPFDHIVGDTRLPKDKDTEVLLYCRSGRMSDVAGNALHAAGYTNLAHLEGGMRAWEAAGRPLLQNPAAHTPAGTAGH